MSSLSDLRRPAITENYLALNVVSEAVVMSVMHRNMADKLAVSAQGCYIDNTATRDLPTQVLAGMSDMTIEACISACASASYKYAAVQVGLH